MLPLAYEDRDRGEPEERAMKVIDATGLSERRHYVPSEFSAGQQQRVAIARALVNDPVLLLADEPTGNLDRRSGIEVLSIFQRLNREGRTLVMITHDEEVAEHARRILVLRDGQIVDDWAVREP